MHVDLINNSNKQIIQSIRYMMYPGKTPQIRRMKNPVNNPLSMIDKCREWFYNTYRLSDKRCLRSTREYRSLETLSQPFQVNNTLITSLFTHAMRGSEWLHAFRNYEHYRHCVHYGNYIHINLFYLLFRKKSSIYADIDSFPSLNGIDLE